MPGTNTPRDEILSRLPAAVRDALDDPAALQAVLDSLPEAERRATRAVVAELLALVAIADAVPGAPEPPADAAPGVPAEDSARLVESCVSLYQPGVTLPAEFQFPDEERVNPPRDSTDRATLSATEAGFLVPVWYATTRQPVDEADPARGFLGERDRQGRVNHGVARVFVPESRLPGSLGSAWWKRWLWLWTDDRVRLLSLKARTRDQFLDGIRKALDAFRERSFQESGAALEGEALVYIHGFNVTFEDAVLRAAQLGCDLKVPGLTACFSWASMGSLAGYVADGATAEMSHVALAEFLRGVVEATGAGKVHVIAHSMGNRVVLRALDEIRNAKSDFQLGQIFLAAPDVDRDVFKLLAPACLSATRKQTTHYLSHKDHAVGFSRRLAAYPRAGYTPPVTALKGLQTIDVTRAVNMSLLGHGYYGDSTRVLYDMREVIHYDAKPETRPLTPKVADGVTYYEFSTGPWGSGGGGPQA